MPSLTISQSLHNICEYIKKEPNSIKFELIEGNFIGLHRIDNPYPDTLIHIFKFEEPQTLEIDDIKYYEIYQTGGILEFIIHKNHFNFRIGLDQMNIDNTLPNWINVDIYTAKIYYFKVGDKIFLCLLCSGSNEYRLGTKQMITFYNLFDITNIENIKYFMLKSRYSCIDNLGDFNNDMKLDFFKFDYAFNTKDEDDFLLEAFSLNEEDYFEPVKLIFQNVKQVLFFHNIKSGMFEIK